MASSSDNIKVAVKARPLIQREITKGLEAVWRTKDNSVYQTDDGNVIGEIYTFDHVFDQQCTNPVVYKSVVHPLFESFMEGFNATLFTYGQTSSGKTHTLLGSKTEDGIFHLIVKDMFKHVAARQDKKYLIRCSYVEIYNEKINDLLDKGNQTVVIREDPKGNMLLNVREAVVSSISDVLEKMQEGNKLRRIGVTSMNQRSSRSHTIFRIILESKDASDDDKHVHISQLNLVDLAGSERLAKSKAAGKRLKEGVNINKSLSTLGIVIRQLSEGKRQFVSYRDSKLTRLLTQALGGNAKSVIIANITLVAGEETKSTLEFAQRAKKVKNKPKVNILSARDEAYQSMKQNLERRIKKQVEVLEEMERHREECFREMERLKVESTIVGHFQSGTPAKQPQKLIRRHTFADYGPSSSRQSKKSPQGGSSPGGEISPIHKDPFENVPDEVEPSVAIPVTLLKRQIKSVEISCTLMKEFAKLDLCCSDEDIDMWRAHASVLERDMESMAQEATRLRGLHSQLQEDMEAMPVQEQPNILKETFRRHKEKIADLRSENDALHQKITQLQHGSAAEGSKLEKIQALEKDKLNLMQLVYELERKVRQLESEGVTTSPICSKRKSPQDPSRLKRGSPDLSPRDLGTIKRHSLVDSRRGPVNDIEPVAGPSKGPAGLLASETASPNREIEILQAGIEKITSVKRENIALSALNRNNDEELEKQYAELTEFRQTEMETLKKEKAATEALFKNAQLAIDDLEKKYMEKSMADDYFKKTMEKLEKRIDKLKTLAQLRRKENLELRKLLNLGEEDATPPPKN